MNAVKLVAVFAENKPGQTARLTKILADANINIRWVTVASIGAFGVMKFLVNDSDLAYQALKHEGYVATLVEVLAAEVPDQPGSLHAVANCLAEHKINLDNTSGFVAGNRAVLIIEVQNVAEARVALQAQKFRALTQKELLSL
ncbi:MAG TPA: ACT domain-containing protein [Verrucomicrobiae bacterium]